MGSVLLHTQCSSERGTPQVHRVRYSATEPRVSQRPFSGQTTRRWFTLISQ